MIYYAPLEKLPDDFAFPDQFQGRFWYDRDRRRLAFDGPMYKSTFDRLRALSHDYDYQRAIEHLFRLAVPDADQPRRHRRLVTAMLALLVAALAVGGLMWPVWRQLSEGPPARSLPDRR